MSISSEKEARQFKKRLEELAEKSYRENQFTFTDFLGLSEQSLFQELLAEHGSTAYMESGGHPLCERRMIRFGSVEELGYEQPFPIVCIRIAPLQKKFAQELGHRDYLGALMHLGIERSTMGDIFVQEGEACLFAQESIAGFIMEELNRINQTNVTCSLTEGEPECLQKEPQHLEYLVSSQRIDSVLSRVCGLSRSRSLLLFREKKVYVSGRLCENNSYVLKDGDAVSVRGYGRFVYRGIRYESRKGKQGICIDRW